MLNTTYFISSYPYLNSMVSNDMPSKVCHKSSMDKLVLSPDPEPVLYALVMLSTSNLVPCLLTINLSLVFSEGSMLN
jgi:hypothetical protein